MNNQFFTVYTRFKFHQAIHVKVLVLIGFRQLQLTWRELRIACQFGNVQLNSQTGNLN